MPDTNAPGDGLWGWLGRQIGYMKTAVKHDPAKPAPTPEKRKADEPAKPQPAAEPPKVVYRTDQVEEVPHPTEPNLKLRRTVIDEVIVDKSKES